MVQAMRHGVLLERCTWMCRRRGLVGGAVSLLTEYGRGTCQAGRQAGV